MATQRIMTAEQKTARLAQVRARRLANPDAVRARDKAWREKNKAKVAAKQKKYQATERGQEASIRSDVKQKAKRVVRVPKTVDQIAETRRVTQAAAYQSKHENTRAKNAVRYETDVEYRQAVDAENKLKRTAKGRATRAKFRLFIDGFKKSCVRCSLTKPKRLLGFHHRDCTTKSFDVSQARGLAKQRVLDEIAKCDVLCVRCHAALHEYALQSLAAVLASLAQAA